MADVGEEGGLGAVNLGKLLGALLLLLQRSSTHEIRGYLTRDEFEKVSVALIDPVLWWRRPCSALGRQWRRAYTDRRAKRCRAAEVRRTERVRFSRAMLFRSKVRLVRDVELSGLLRLHCRLRPALTNAVDAGGP